MKRVICIALTLVLLLGLCACGDKAESKTDTKTKTTTAAVGSTTASSTTATEGDTATTTASSTTATEGDTSTTASHTPSTSGTAVTKPTYTKPTTPKDDQDNAIRVLAVGDDYAVDAMEAHLYQMLKGAGYDTVHLGILYVANSSLDTHYAAVKADSKTYEFRQNTNGKWTKETKVAPSAAFKKADWDVIVVQQSGADAGMPNTYGKLDDLTALIKQQCSDADILWHMTWAFRRQSGATGFANYQNNEKTMYEAIVKAALQQAFQDDNIAAIIPSATTIQNLRTSPLQDSLSTDGVRLNDSGDYAAALTWYCLLTGESATTVTYRPDAIKSQFAELADATDNSLAAPNTITPSKNEVKDLKILSIGHSFSVDAMKTYMWDLFDAAGYNVTIGYLYYPSCSLEQHYHYIKDNSKSYEQYGKNQNGEWVYQKNVDALTALNDEDWDIVTFQPDPDFGYDKFLNNVPCKCEWGCNANIASDYIHFNELVDMVKTKLAANGNTDVKFYYHLTWTWRKDCYLGPYLYPNGYDQLTLWQDFIDATKNKVLTNKNILGVIPCNTAIENARTSWMGDTFNAEAKDDGYHLNDKGDLVAALTWVCYFTGAKASTICMNTGFTDAEFAAIAEAVDNAIANQWKVTPSTHTKQP